MKSLKEKQKKKQRNKKEKKKKTKSLKEMTWISLGRRDETTKMEEKKNKNEKQDQRLHC